MCGTAEFLAPEIINFEDISFLTDMWAVGVICYILMSGYSPFLGDTDGDTYNNIARSGTPTFDSLYLTISHIPLLELTLLVKDNFSVSFQM